MKNILYAVLLGAFASSASAEALLNRGDDSMSFEVPRIELDNRANPGIDIDRSDYHRGYYDDDYHRRRYERRYRDRDRYYRRDNRRYRDYGYSYDSDNGFNIRYGWGNDRTRIDMRYGDGYRNRDYYDDGYRRRRYRRYYDSW